MIPKIIHYCWFGGKTISSNLNKYIEGWKKILPDYEFMLWDESKFNVNSVTWTKEAYKAGKFAFVADYVRIYALSQFGGIYLDTDVQVIKTFNPFLKHNAFLSFEGDECLIGTAVIGATKDASFLLEMLDYYKNNRFMIENMGLIQNTTLLQNIFIRMGLELNNKYQSIGDGIKLYPLDFFSAKIVQRDEYHITENTVCIHQYNMSWFPLKLRLWIKFTNFFIKPLKRFFGLMPAKYQ